MSRPTATALLTLAACTLRAPSTSLADAAVGGSALTDSAGAVPEADVPGVQAAMTPARSAESAHDDGTATHENAHREGQEVFVNAEFREEYFKCLRLAFDLQCDRLGKARAKIQLRIEERVRRPIVEVSAHGLEPEELASVERCLRSRVAPIAARQPLPFRMRDTPFGYCSKE